MGDFAQYPHVRMPVRRSVVEPADIPEQGRQTVPTLSRVAWRSRPTLWVAGAGALAYCSWPLAFLVNPSLAGSALASSFEGRSQPFSWLFILLDCVAGLCAGIVCVRELRPRPSFPRPAKVLVLALLGYGVFGAATAVDAVVPLNCGSISVQSCASQIWPLTPDDFLTGTAVLALFVAAVAVIVEMTRGGLDFPSFVPVVSTVTLIAWGGLGLSVLMPVTSDTAAAVCQYAFLTLTSVLTFAIPLVAASARRSRPSSAKALPVRPPTRRSVPRRYRRA